MDKKHYELYLFDLDDTLFDFKTSERHALNGVHQHLGLTKDFATFHKAFVEINHELWERFAKGELTKNFLREERFRRLFELLKLEHSSSLASNLYIEKLALCDFLIEDAHRILDSVKQHAQIGIITNGIEDVQYRKMKNARIDDKVDFVIVSEKAGFPKPDVRIFDYALSVAKHTDKKTVLMIGDRVDVDVLGGQNAGLDTCWFNPERKPNPFEVRPTYEIHSLTELEKIRIGDL